MIRACQKFRAVCPTTFCFQIIFGTSSTNQSEDGKIFARYSNSDAGKIQVVEVYKTM